MSLRPLRGAFTPSRGYVCLRCRLSVKFQQTLRNQHTSHETIDISNGADLDGDSDRILQISPKSSTAAKTLKKITAESRAKPKRKIELLKSKNVDLPIVTIPFDESRSPERDLIAANVAHDVPAKKKSRKEKEPPKKISKASSSTLISMPTPAKKEVSITPSNETLEVKEQKRIKKKGKKPRIKKIKQESKKEKAKESKAVVRLIATKGKPKKSRAVVRRIISGENEIKKSKARVGLIASMDEPKKSRAVVRRIVSRPQDGIGSIDFERALETPEKSFSVALTAQGINVSGGGTRKNRGKQSQTSRASSDENDVLSSIRKLINVLTVDATQLQLNSILIDQPSVPSLSYGLDRVLFNPGVYQLQDIRSRVFNFDPYLQTIMPVAEFDFNSLKEYITSSRDTYLNDLAQKHGRRYVGSSSSMTGVLSHFHYLLSQWRDINVDMLSKGFPDRGFKSFTLLQRSPSAIFLRWKDGTYAIDADKQFAKATVLSMLGKSMEKLLTLDTPSFERYRKSNPDQISVEERDTPETYHYSTMGDFLMRAQLDAHDPRLPGSGTFDLKTRAVLSIRMDATNYSSGTGYEIRTGQGEFESYEREYFDMIRAAFLKYSLQVRMGKMDGIFVAFHNVERIFGFQYISLPEMDLAIHGHSDTTFGDQEFKLSLDLMNKVLDRATIKYPKTSLRIHFETRNTQTNFMYIFAEPMTEEQVKQIQSTNDAKVEEFERSIRGLHEDKPRDDETGWANIEANVQEAMNKDEMSFTNSENDDALDVLGDVNSNSNPKESQIQLFHEDCIVGAIKEDVDVGKDFEKEKKGTEESGGIIKGDIGEMDHATEEESTNEMEGVFKRETGDQGHQGDRQSTNLEGDRSAQAIEDTEFEITAKDSKTSGAESVESAQFFDQHLENDGLQISHHQAQPGDSVENLGTSVPGPGFQTDRQRLNDLEPDESQNAEVDTQEEQSSARRLVSTADVPFLESIEAERLSDASDVLAMTLTIRNKVNDKYVVRPTDLKRDDRWTVEYSLNEVTNQTRASVLYKACQLRRKKFLEVENVDTENDSFFQMLKELSRQGAYWRKQMDKEDMGKPRIVLTQSAGVSVESKTRAEDTVA